MSWAYIDNDHERSIDTLSRVVRIRNYADQQVSAKVREARANGVTWKEIGKCLGVSRQAACQKYGRS